MIGIAAAVEIADGALDALVGMEPVGRDNEAVIAARHTVVNPNAVAHEARRRIARVTRALGDGNHVRGELDRRPLAEYARVLRIHPRLDRRERRIGVLEHGEMLIEDCAA